MAPEGPERPAKDVHGEREVLSSRYFLVFCTHFLSLQDTLTTQKHALLRFVHNMTNRIRVNCPIRVGGEGECYRDAQWPNKRQ